MKLMACVLNDLCILCVCVCLVSQLCPTLCDPMDCRPPGSSVPGDFPGKNTGVGCHGLLQGIFPTQGSNPGLLSLLYFLHCRWILYSLSHLGRCLRKWKCVNFGIFIIPFKPGKKNRYALTIYLGNQILFKE